MQIPAFLFKRFQLHQNFLESLLFTLQFHLEHGLSDIVLPRRILLQCRQLFCNRIEICLFFADLIQDLICDPPLILIHVIMIRNSLCRRIILRSEYRRGFTDAYDHKQRQQDDLLLLDQHFIELIVKKAYPAI